MNKKDNLKDKIINQLKQVYDPEFPLVDIRTLWMIYNIDIDPDKKTIHILMTLTSPMCPVWDTIVDMVKNSILELDELKDWNVEVELTFDPTWEPSMIKDENIRKMFI